MSRMFRTFEESNHEILRDIVERGIRVHPETMQDKIVEDNIDFETMEIQNVHYTITQPNLEHLNPIQPWADAEWKERIEGGYYGNPVNPGDAWELRSDVWDQFRERDGQFAYSYSERLNAGGTNQIKLAIKELKKHPNSRQVYIAIWDPMLDPIRRGVRRVPCSLGYSLLLRQNRLDITYTMRSCDWMTHYQNDLYLARKLQEFIADQVGVEAGHFTHIVNSLHIYKKDADGVF